MSLSLLWKSFLVFIGRLFFFLFMKLRVYKYWSRLYQFLWERERNPVKGFSEMWDLVSYIKTFKWRPDGWLQLGDAISNPGHVQWIADNDPERRIGDCDDFAAYEIDVVRRQLLHGRLIEGGEIWIRGASMLTVPWLDLDTNSFGGHNVCLMRVGISGKTLEEDEKTMYCYMDYGDPSTPKETIQEVVDEIVHRVGRNLMSLGWAVSDIYMTPVQQSWM